MDAGMAPLEAWESVLLRNVPMPLGVVINMWVGFVLGLLGCLPALIFMELMW